MDNKLITVTSPLLPNLDDFTAELKKIWESKWITNNGSYHKLLEKELAAYLKVPFVSHCASLARLSPLRTALWLPHTVSGGMVASPCLWISTQLRAI